MLGRCRRRRANIDRTLVQGLVFAGILLNSIRFEQIVQIVEITSCLAFVLETQLYN